MRGRAPLTVNYDILHELADVLPRSWERKTSYNPSTWMESSAASGQCAITALVVQDRLAGHILRGMVNGVEHFWNSIPPVGEVDLTREQFGRIASATMGLPTSREELLANPDTRRRYYLLKANIRRAQASLGARRAFESP